MQNTKRLGELALSDTGFAFDPYSGSTFTINATGLSVVQAMKEGLAMDAVVDRLRERFDVRSADVRRDVEDFTALLRQHGLVTDEAPGPPGAEASAGGLGGAAPHRKEV